MKYWCFMNFHLCKTTCNINVSVLLRHQKKKAALSACTGSQQPFTGDWLNAIYRYTRYTLGRCREHVSSIVQITLVFIFQRQMLVH